MFSRCIKHSHIVYLFYIVFLCSIASKINSNYAYYNFFPFILDNCFRDNLSKNSNPAARSIDSGGT